MREDHRAQIQQMLVPPSGPIPFDAAAEHFLQWSRLEHRDHPNTARRHAVSMASLTHFFGRKSVERITPGELEDFKTWRRGADIKEVTIRHDLHALSRFFQFGQRHGWCAQNPVRLIDMPSDRASRNEKVISTDEEKRYFAAAKANVDLFDVGRLILLQGLRPDEVLSLKKAAVDLAEKTLTVVHSKSAASRRTLNLTDESCRILGRRFPGEAIWCFPGKRPGRHLTYSGLVNAHNKSLEKSSTWFNLYSLRHTFATRFYKQTKDIEALRRILGHADLKTLLRYVHIDQEQIRAAMEQFEKSLKPLEGITIQ